MSADSLDFNNLNRLLLSTVRDIIIRWLPGGKLIGAEYTCGSLRGERGDSLKVNINTGRWADFATDDKGGDLVALYAAINGLEQGEAFKELAKEFTFEQNGNGVAVLKPESEIIQPPIDIDISKPLELFAHRDYGQPSAVWFYRNTDNEILFAVARYEVLDSKGEPGKQILPWTWNRKRYWNCKGWPAPRPLFGLEQFKGYDKKNPKKVLIVEGEKSAVAAREIAGEFYIVLTWPNGAQALDKADWSLIRDMIVLLWPDADEPGKKAMQSIAEKLANQGCKIKILDVDDKPDGWDAADALAEGMDWSKLKEWGSPKVKVYEKPSEIITATAIAENEKIVAAAQVNVQVTNEDSGIVTIALSKLWDQLGLTLTKSDVPNVNYHNALRVLTFHPPLHEIVWYDEFHDKIFTKYETGIRREWTDNDDAEITIFFQSIIGMVKMTKECISTAITYYAMRNTKNEPRDWFETLVHDGVDRLSHFFEKYFGAEYNAYTHKAAMNFWVGMVARVYQPGCKNDHMIVLEGKQGIGKSRAIAAIGGPWYSEANEDIRNKDFFMTLSGKLILEIGELDSFNKAEVTRIKQVISCKEDRYRAPYDVRPKDHKRQSIFIGSTNEDNYLRDSTGGRRFWPIKCGTHINVEAIEKDRDQLFAQAVLQFKQKDEWWIMPIDETLREQETRRESDPREEMIAEYLQHQAQTTMREVLAYLKIDNIHIHRELRPIGKCLRIIGWIRKPNPVSVNGIPTRVWVKKESKE